MSLFALFKGDSKSGKTVAAVSFPDPVIVLDFDKKGPAITRKHFPHKEVTHRFFKDAIDTLDLIKRWKTESCAFNTIVVDTITSLSAQILWTIDDNSGQNILKYLQDFKANEKKAGEFRSFNHYKVEDAFLKEFIDDLKTIWLRPGFPNYVLVNAHVLTSEESDIKTKKVTRTRRIVTAGRAIAAYIPAQFDEAWHFGVAHGDLLAGQDSNKPRVEHFCTTEAVGDDYASTAYNLPYEIDFTNSSLYDKIKGEIDQAQPTTQTEEKPKAAKQLLNF